MTSPTPLPTSINPVLQPAISLPKHKLLESPNSRSIIIGNWRITASTNPISNAGDCDALQGRLGIPLPEMTFGSNFLRLEYRDDRGFDTDDRQDESEETQDAPEDTQGWIYEFDTESALRGVKNGQLEPGDGGVKVNYADAWLKSRTGPSPLLPMPQTVPTKPYDWTYTTTYAGHSSTSADESGSAGSSERDSWFPADPSNSEHSIPLAELTRPDPILFYAEVPLFEDELHDNGSSGLLVRIRVMPICIFILARFTLRVDGVLFRTFDTRLYHSFERSQPPLIIRETSGWEAPYESVKTRLPKRNDLTPLTDPTFIAKILTESRQSQTTGAETGWRGLGRRCEWTVPVDLNR